MANQLTKKTKDLIKLIINNEVDNLIETFPFYYNHHVLKEEYSELNQKALEHLQDNFDKIESDYDLLQDYYNDNGDVKDYEILKQLSLEFAQKLI